MKRKSTIIILTAILIGSFYNEIYAQGNDFYYFQSNRNTVLASNGLNMRSKPNTNSTKIVNIPYGEKVNIIHKDHYGLDTVYTIKTELADYPVYGYWQKVSYKGHTGFVHNAFLYFSSDYPQEEIAGLNPNYVLLRPGFDCSSDFYNSNEYIWYGYYQEPHVEGEQPNKSYRKIVDVEFINITNDMMGSGTIVKENRHLQFIVGSKVSFGDAALGNILEAPLYSRTNSTEMKLDSSVFRQANITIVNNDEPTGYFDHQFFYLHKGNTMQLINTVSDSYRIFLSSYFVQADIDGDGQLDYIFGHDPDHRSTGLYLSSEANEEEVVHLVDIMRRGPCC